MEAKQIAKDGPWELMHYVPSAIGSEFMFIRHMTEGHVFECASVGESKCPGCGEAVPEALCTVRDLFNF